MKKRYIIICILFLLFIVNTYIVSTDYNNYIDDTIYNCLFSFRSSNLDAFFKMVTYLANPTGVIITIFILLIFLHKENIYRLILSVASIVGTNQILKHTLRRTRPYHLRLVTENGFSYPSGHSMVSIAIYGLLIYIVYKYVKNKIIKTILIILLSSLILMIGISRIYLGVHYPTDITGGYLIAIPILILVNGLLTDHFRGK